MKINTTEELRKEQDIKVLQEDLKEMYLKHDTCSDWRLRSSLINNISCFEIRIKELIKRKKILSLKQEEGVKI